MPDCSATWVTTSWKRALMLANLVCCLTPIVIFFVPWALARETATLAVLVKFAFAASTSAWHGIPAPGKTSMASRIGTAPVPAGRTARTRVALTSLYAGDAVVFPRAVTEVWTPAGTSGPTATLPLPADSGLASRPVLPPVALLTRVEAKLDNEASPLTPTSAKERDIVS